MTDATTSAAPASASGSASTTPAPPPPAPTIKKPTSSSAADSDSAAPTATARATTTATTTTAARRSTRQGQPDPLSDRATATLIRRTLCPQQLGDKTRDVQPPLEDLLPPLTSRNDVDLQLYAFLAIILREFVQSWYGRITTDEAFVAEIVHTVAHCTRALEQRFRKVDMESLLLDEIPDLVDKHISAYRAAHRAIPPLPLEPDARQIYHSLCPMPPLSPVPREDDQATADEQDRNEAAYRQLLVQAVLAVLLPTEDLENPCLTSLVGQIFSELIIGNVIANKAAQPWMLWEGICIAARVLQDKKTDTAERLVGRSQTQQTQAQAQMHMHNGNPAAAAGKSRRGWSVHGFFLSIINLCLVFVTSIRILAGFVTVSSSLPPRDNPALPEDKETGPLEDHGTRMLRHDAPVNGRTPILEYRMWSCAANLIQLPLRKPWLDGILSLVQHAAINGPGHIGGFNGVIDRFLHNHTQSFFSPSHLPPLLRSLRGALFPNNAPGKPTLVAPSSEDELLALRRRAASALWGLLPSTLGRLYLGGRLGLRRGFSPSSEPSANADADADNEDERMIDQVEELLMFVSDEYCNKHLLYGILELILVRLMPELSEKGVKELWDERLGSG